MSQRLKNIVRFTNITPNVAASLPHGLRDSLGHPLRPDVATPSIEGFTITADEINVTVQGNGTAIDVLCEAWHTLERSFGTLGEDAFEDLVPQPFVPLGTGGADVQAFSNFVFRPGGVAGGNVYTDWAALVAAKSLVQGFKTIQFDGSLNGGVCVVPAGVWDMTDTELFALGDSTFGPNAFAVQVDFSNGTSFPNLRYIGNEIFINNLNTVTAPIIIPDSGMVMEIGKSSKGAFPFINNTGGAPFIAATPTSGIVVMRLQGRIQGTAPAISFTGAPAGTRLVLGMFDSSAIFANMIVGAVGQTVSLLRFAASTIAYQPNFLGNISPGTPGGNFLGNGLSRSFVLPTDAVTGKATAPSTVPFAGTSLRPNTTLRFDTGAVLNPANDIAQTLPRIVAVAIATGADPNGEGIADSIGLDVTIKNELGVNNVNVTPNVVAPAETIEGGAGPVVVPPGGSRTFRSLGNGNWIIVGGYL